MEMKNNGKSSLREVSKYGVIPGHFSRRALIRQRIKGKVFLVRFSYDEILEFLK